MPHRADPPGRRVLLLRGVNVGGHGRLPMAELRALLAELGCAEVATYLQSGNAVVLGGPPDLAQRLKERIGVVVLERTAADLAALICANPFPQVQDPTRLVVAFLSEQPDASSYEALDPASYAPDELALGDRALYVHYPRGQGRASLKPAQIAPTGIVATVRNWRTVLALAEMSSPDA